MSRSTLRTIKSKAVHDPHRARYDLTSNSTTTYEAEVYKEVPFLHYVSRKKATHRCFLLGKTLVSCEPSALQSSGRNCPSPPDLSLRELIIFPGALLSGGASLFRRRWYQ